MTGYQEICTDPSYRGQMVVLTHPQVGNYGVVGDRPPSRRGRWLTALIVRELADFPNHWESQRGSEQLPAAGGVPGLEGIDTRALTRRLRARGALRAVIRQAGPARLQPATTSRRICSEEAARGHAALGEAR